jgi:hypothetical protein
LLPKNKVVSMIFYINVDLFGPLRLIEFSMFSFTHLLRDNIYFLFFRNLCIQEPGIYPILEVPIVALPTVNIKNCHCVHLLNPKIILLIL